MIDEVASNVRESFLDEGMDDQLLQDFKAVSRNPWLKIDYVASFTKFEIFSIFHNNPVCR